MDAVKKMGQRKTYTGVCDLGYAPGQKSYIHLQGAAGESVPGIHDLAGFVAFVVFGSAVKLGDFCGHGVIVVASNFVSRHTRLPDEARKYVRAAPV